MTNLTYAHIHQIGIPTIPESFVMQIESSLLLKFRSQDCNNRESPANYSFRLSGLVLVRTSLQHALFVMVTLILLRG